MERLKDLEKEFRETGYREDRMETGFEGLKEKVAQIGVETDRDNANVGNNFSAKLLRIASVTNRAFNIDQLPTYLAMPHLNGDIYYHDLDSYNLTTNCLNIETGKVLRKGFNTGYGTVKPPQRIESAGELSCILLQSTQNDMFGGQSHVDFDNDMAYFVDKTREEVNDKLISTLVELGVYSLEKDVRKALVEKEVEERVRQAMQGVVFNLNTMHSRAGSQVPFSSINIGIPKSKDAELVCRLFLQEYEKGLGKGEQPIFPNIIFRVKSGFNRNPGDKYYHLFKLACRVASKRMNPMFMNLDADFNKAFYDKGIIPATMGCRTYVCSNINGEEGSGGRGNIAPVTINLPRLGILAEGNIDCFFELLKSRLVLARDSLLHRYEVLKKLKVRDLPFVAGQGLMKGSENLSPNDSIEPILKQGTWGIGFIGLAETLVALIGKHHGESEEAEDLGYRIVSYIRDFCDRYKEIDKLNWSCYATPAEGLSGKFIAQDKKVFGEIEGVTDKDYYTNSYHVPVGYSISIFQKLKKEAPFHKLCNGGHISYIELDGYPDGDTVEYIIRRAYELTNISYIGINFHMRYCRECGEIVESSHRLCPSCGSDNIQGVSRVTGYLSLDERFGAGKVAERRDRVAHNGGNKQLKYVYR